MTGPAYGGKIALLIMKKEPFTSDEQARTQSLQDRVDGLEKSNRELERMNKVKDEFLYVMSHEFRNPLTTIMGYAAMIQEEMLGHITQRQDKSCATIIRQASDLLNLVDSLLAATKIETNSLKVEIQEVDLGEFLIALKSVYAGFLHKELSLNWDFAPDLPLMRTDTSMLKHILHNLINNAIKFTGVGRVTVSARYLPGEKAVDFKVSDNGVGISEDQLPYIFEKSRQTDRPGTARYGANLGLYIVRNFTELLGGKVGVESEPGKGSTFTVTLPC